MVQAQISRTHFPVTTLGPGRRVGVWFQGCSIQCPGCISADTWGFKQSMTTTVEDLHAVIAPLINKADGVTITGGEPFDQPDALLKLLKLLNLRDHQDMLIYTGHPIEHIHQTLSLASGLVDALISDPFKIAAPQTLALRGSDNQRLHILTERGRQRFSTYEQASESTKQSLDVMFADDGTVWLAGIPRRGDMLHLQQLLSEQGHSILTTDAKGTMA